MESEKIIAIIKLLTLAPKKNMEPPNKISETGNPNVLDLEYLPSSIILIKVLTCEKVS